jgi:hypothetical protein
MDTVPRQMNIHDRYAFLTAFFLHEKIDFALIGAFAMHAYGYTRATRDVDFVVRRTDQDTIIGCIEAHGFTTMHRSQGFSNHQHGDDRTRIDILYVDDATAGLIFADARLISLFDDAPIPVASPEHLVAMKLFAVKNDPSRTFKDLADIQELIRRCGLDAAVIRHYLRVYSLEHWSNALFPDDIAS